MKTSEVDGTATIATSLPTFRVRVIFFSVWRNLSQLRLHNILLQSDHCSRSARHSHHPVFEVSDSILLAWGNYNSIPSKNCLFTTTIQQSFRLEIVMMKPRSASMQTGPRPPITIYEDDSLPNPKVRKNGVKAQKMRRCVSVPMTLFDVESILKWKTVDESLHSTYGSESGSRNSDAKLQFKSVVIREYARTVGDNPSCSSGPPVRYVEYENRRVSFVIHRCIIFWTTHSVLLILDCWNSISWEYNVAGELSLDDYENSRPPRRTHFEMVLPRKVRHDILRKEWDVRQKDIAEAVRRNVKVKNQRKATVNNLNKAPKMEEALESLSRKLKRIATFSKPVSAQVRQLDQQMEKVMRQRSKMRLDIQMAQEYDDDDDVASTEENSSSWNEAVSSKLRQCWESHCVGTHRWQLPWLPAFAWLLLDLCSWCCFNRFGLDFLVLFHCFSAPLFRCMLPFLIHRFSSLAHQSTMQTIKKWCF